MTQVPSAVKHLTPTLILENGVPIAQATLQTHLTALSDYIYSHSLRIWTQNAQILTNAFQTTKKSRFKQRYLRDLGINTTLPSQPGYLTGNMREIIEHKICTEAESWARNPNPHKQPFTFNKNIDLSATNDQLSTRTYSKTTNTITLTLRCFDTHLTLIFQLPGYLTHRTLTKVSKPRVRWNGKSFVFDFTTYEEVTPARGRLNAGIDLGKVKSYVTVVTNERGKRVADYSASRGLMAGWDKYYRLGELAGRLRVKICSLQALSLDASLLETEHRLVTSKRSRLHVALSKRQASEVVRVLGKHDVGLVRVEDLKWLSGGKGVRGRGGRWSFGRQQSDLEHGFKRRGVRLVTVSPRGSSQVCCKCGVPVVHNAVRRSVYCGECKTVLDRDFNAAFNIATLNHLKSKEWLARFYGSGESNCTGLPEIIAPGSQVSSAKTLQVVKLVT